MGRWYRCRFRSDQEHWTALTGETTANDSVCEFTDIRNPKPRQYLIVLEEVGDEIGRERVNELLTAWWRVLRELPRADDHDTDPSNLDDHLRTAANLQGSTTLAALEAAGAKHGRLPR